mgnify:CR=1 FL=1
MTFTFFHIQQPTNVILWTIKFHAHAEKATWSTMTMKKTVWTSMNAWRIMEGRLLNVTFDFEWVGGWICHKRQVSLKKD